MVTKKVGSKDPLVVTMPKRDWEWQENDKKDSRNVNRGSFDTATRR